MYIKCMGNKYVCTGTANDVQISSCWVIVHCYGLNLNVLYKKTGVGQGGTNQSLVAHTSTPSYLGG
jgi:hypothetical protein